MLKPTGQRLWLWMISWQPVGCYLSDPLFVNTPAPGNNILGTFSVTQEVKQTNLESFAQEIFFTGPRFGSGYMSATDLRHLPGDYGTRYETVASTPMIEKAMVRALRGTNNGADPPVAATPNHPKLDCVNIETYWNPWFWESISRNPIRNTIFDYWRAPAQTHFCKKISNLCWLFTCEMTCVLFNHKSLALLQSHVAHLCCGHRESPHCQEVNTTFNDVKGCDEVKDRNGGQTAKKTAPS